MRPSRGTVRALHFEDLVTFLAVTRASSITAAARMRRVTPSQVSKAIHRLEAHLGTRLLARGARGVTVTVAAAQLAPQVEEIVQRVGGLRSLQLATELSIAAPSFLNAIFLPAVASALPRLRVRGIELPPALVRAYVTEDLFDIALTLGREAFPSAWDIALIGPVAKGLFATPATARRIGGRRISSERLANVPFIVPIYQHNGRSVVADEGCPLADKRRIGHEAQTVSLGLEMAVHTGQVIFSPKIVAKPYVERGELVEISVLGWDVREGLYAAYNCDRLLAKTRDTAIAAIRARFTALTAA